MCPYGMEFPRRETIVCRCTWLARSRDCPRRAGSFRMHFPKTQGETPALRVVLHCILRHTEKCPRPACRTDPWASLLLSRAGFTSSASGSYRALHLSLPVCDHSQQLLVKSQHPRPPGPRVVAHRERHAPLHFQQPAVPPRHANREERSRRRVPSLAMCVLCL